MARTQQHRRTVQILGTLLLAISCQDGTAPKNFKPTTYFDVIEGGCPSSDPGCAGLLRDPNEFERAQIKYDIQRLQWSTDSKCVDIGFALNFRYTEGKIRVWDGPTYDRWGDYHGSGNPSFPNEIHLWEPSNNPGFTKTLIHEGSHDAFGLGGDGPATEGPSSPYYWENRCFSIMATTAFPNRLYAFGMASDANKTGGE
jgi:hypothetical protein